MAPQYKVHYFDAQGAGEPIRLVLAYANVPFDDVRIAKEDWPQLKPSMPWGQLPVLEVDGKYLAQSSTIVRYLARKYNLTGETEWDAGKCDELLDALGDLRQECRKFFYEQDEAKKAEVKKQLAEETFPKYLGKFSDILKNNGSGYLVGKKLTFIDIVFSNFVEQMGGYLGPNLLDSFPDLQKHVGLVNSQPGIKEWIAKRPQPVPLH